MTPLEQMRAMAAAESQAMNRDETHQRNRAAKRGYTGQRKALVEIYHNAGFTTKQIAAKIGISQAAVSRHKKSLGIKPERKQKMKRDDRTPEQKERQRVVLEAIGADRAYSTNEIAEAVGLDNVTTGNVLTALRTRGMVTSETLKREWGGPRRRLWTLTDEGRKIAPMDEATAKINAYLASAAKKGSAPNHDKKRFSRPKYTPPHVGGWFQ